MSPLYKKTSMLTVLVILMARI